jgi:hypothetical protein
MSEQTTHMDAVAIRKAGIEGWEPFKWERVGEDVLFTGGIPRLLQSGPRKGRKTWDGKGSSVVVTRGEEAAEYARYEATTGECGTCYGKAEVFASWHHIDGTKYRPCAKCNSTGKAQSESPVSPHSGAADTAGAAS